MVIIVTVAILVVAGLVAVSVGIYWHMTGPPPLLPPPYMRLEALFEEPLGHGWGVDIPGYGPSLNLSSLQVDPGSQLLIFLYNCAGSHAETCSGGPTRRHAPVLQPIS